MTEQERHDAYVAQQQARIAFQASLDAALLPPSDAPAEAIRADWQPMTDFIREGPDIGKDDPEPQVEQRF